MVYFLVQFIYHWYIYIHIDTYIDTWSIFGSPQKTTYPMLGMDVFLWVDLLVFLGKSS